MYGQLGESQWGPGVNLVGMGSCRPYPHNAPLWLSPVMAAPAPTPGMWPPHLMPGTPPMMTTGPAHPLGLQLWPQWCTVPAAQQTAS